MKRFLIIGLIVALALIVIGGVGVVFAQVQDNPKVTAVTVTTGPNGNKIIRQFGYGAGGPQVDKGILVSPDGQQGDKIIQIRPGSGGMMNRNGQGYGPGGMMGGYGRGGMMGGWGMGEYGGVMHQYMISAFASAVGLTVDEVNTRLTNGETLAEIAVAQGKTKADLPALWSQIQQDALKKAVADGVITQAQADLMLQHMNNYADPGFGPGFDGCPMWDGDEAQP